MKSPFVAFGDFCCMLLNMYKLNKKSIAIQILASIFAS